MNGENEDDEEEEEEKKDKEEEEEEDDDEKEGGGEREDREGEGRSRKITRMGSEGPREGDRELRRGVRTAEVKRNVNGRKRMVWASMDKEAERH